MRRHLSLSVMFGLVASAALFGQQSAPSQDVPLFRTGVNLVLVDVVVRDRSGAVVKGLKTDDFELLEDGVRQQILTFAYEEIASNAAPVVNASTLAGAAAHQARTDTARAPAPTAAAAPAAAAASAG